MKVIHNTNPIEQSFRHWINNYPELFHPLDMERFYIFVKCICCYSRKTKGFDWLKQKIKDSGKKLPKDVVNTYCYKFVELQKFYNSPCMQVYEYK